MYLYHTRILLVLLLFNLINANQKKMIDLVKQFIENEHKPTQLIHKLCWNKHDQLHLVKEIAKLGVRTSTSTGSIEYHEQAILFFVDLDCDGAEDVIADATKRGFFRFPYRWLAVSAAPITDPDYTFLLWNRPLLADSDFVLAETTEDGYKLSEIHKPSPLASMEVTQRGIYNGTYVDIRPHRELFRRRCDVKGHLLTMANVIQDSNTTKIHLPMEDRLDLEHDSIAKVCWSNVRAAMEILNATPGYIFSYRWGYKQNGQWSGMVEDLRSGRADLGTNCLVKAYRLEVVTYTDDLAPYRVAFVFRQPPLSYVANIFSMPFSSNVWLALVLCVAVSTGALYLTSKHEANFGKNSSQLDGSVGDVLLLTMSAVSQQGCFMEPKKASGKLIFNKNWNEPNFMLYSSVAVGRILVFVLFTGLMALYAAYSANVVVLLQAPSNSIRTLSQLAQSKITLAANDVDYSYFIFKANKNDIPRTEIVRRVFPEKGKKPFYEMEAGVKKIREGLFAFHSIVEPVYRQIEKTFLEIEKCDLMEVDFLNDFPGHIPVRKDSPYLELLRVAFKRVRETGIRAVISARYQVERPRCRDKSAAFSSAGLLDLRPVLFLMLLGFALASAVALAEVAVFRISRRIKLIVL